MRFEHYDGIVFNDEKLEYRFVSEGPKGKIIKIVRFDPTKRRDLYNLTFGNLKKMGFVDDDAIDDNKDRNKILKTITIIIYRFTSLYPGALIFFTGSTPARTRLFRMILTSYNNDLKKDYQLYGVKKDKNGFTREPFRKNVDYFGFAIKKK